VDSYLERLEALLVESVRFYVEPSVSVWSPRDSRPVCSNLQYLLEYFLDDHKVLNRWAYVDGILPDVIDVVSEGEMTVRGTAVWNEDHNCWVDPFFAAVSISSAGLRYEIRFADVARGLRQHRYGIHGPCRHSPTEWLFTFSRDQSGPPRYTTP
jgi:hypothetical protein